MTRALFIIAVIISSIPLPSAAHAQYAEPFDAARVPGKPLRLEKPPQKHPSDKLDAGVTDDRSRRLIYFAPKVTTIFPLFLGAGAELSYRNKLALGASYGFTPKPYYKAIAEAAASVAHDQSYKPIIEAAFQKNSVVRGYLEYRFGEGSRGWQIGTAASRLISNGSTTIDAVEDSTGTLFDTLRAILIGQQKDPVVFLNSKLTLAELYVGYGWTVWHHVNFAFDLGLAKVFGANLHLHTDAPSYDNSASGSAQLRSSESDLEKIIRQNGFTPTLGLRVGWVF